MHPQPPQLRTSDPATARGVTRFGLTPARRLLACAMLASVATASSGAIAAGATGQAGAPQTGGVLKVAFDGDPRCIDPQQVGNNTALNVGRQLTDSLTDQRPENGEIVPWLAERWTVSPDSREFSFFLRDGVTFSDGTPVDARAVKANFEAIIKMGARATLGSTYLAGLKSITVPDARTVTITFEQPNAQFLQATSTMSLGLFAQTTLDATAEARCQGALVGSGPFVFDTFVSNQRVTLKHREGYAWPSSLAKHQTRAYLDGIEFRIIPESGVRNGSLISRQIDVNTSVQPQDEKVLEAQKLPILARSNPGLVYSLFPNFKTAVPGDIAVRRAVNKGIDRPELQAIISRYQKPATSVLALTTPLYVDQAAALAYDPAGARKLLDEAGWKETADGVREKDGQKLVLVLQYWQSTPFLELIQQQLRAIGVDLQLNKATISQVTALRDTGKLDIQFYNLTRADPDILRTVFISDGRNVNFRERSEVDDLLAKSAGTLDTAVRQDLIARAADLLVTDGNAIPLVELATVTATGKNVFGLHYEASSRLQFYDTWLKR